MIAEAFLEDNNETRGKALTNIDKIEATLRFLGDPGFQTGIANDIGFNQSSKSRAIDHVLSRISSNVNDFITFPLTDDAQIQAKSGFYNKFNYPSILSAIDCTHIKIKKPSVGNFGDEYINRKGFASINLQCTCDSDFVFTSFDASNPGSVHDQRVFRNSDLYGIMEQLNNSILIGDDGYALTPFMMIPFRDPRNAREKYFNKIHCKARVVIEQAFGQLKMRFPALHYGIRLKLDRIPKAIVSALILYNISKILNDDLNEFEEFPIMPLIPNGPVNNNNNQMHQRGIIKRNRISQILYGN